MARVSIKYLHRWAEVDALIRSKFPGIVRMSSVVFAFETAMLERLYRMVDRE